MKIKFCGAAKTVTGSCYYIETSGSKFLIDCGMFQGSKHELNNEPFPFNPADIDFMILTHAHIDHSGRIPLILKQGFKGRIYCTSATAELINIMLKDSAHIQEMEAQWKTKKNLRKGLQTVEPLYTVKDAEIVSDFVYPVLYNQTIELNDNIKFTMKDAGHLLGSAFIVLEIEENGQTKVITFSGDLGNIKIPILKDYEYVDKTDYLVIESTYGNRIHELEQESMSLYDIILKTVEGGGNVIIPSFAVGRTQEIIYLLNYYIDVEKRNRLKNVEIFMDSPLAIEATEVFARHLECYNEETLKVIASGDNPLEFANLHITKTAEESKSLNNKNGVVIISSSGMCEAGRIKHHLKHNIWRSNSAIVFVGYQAEGTLGRKILDGEKKVTILGEEIIVKAQIYSIPSLSGHADLNGLLNWVNNIKQGVAHTIFITHGDIKASENFEKVLNEISHVKTIIPDINNEYLI